MTPMQMVHHIEGHLWFEERLKDWFLSLKQKALIVFGVKQEKAEKEKTNA